MYTDPLLTTSLGRYRLERVLGEGGMGRVYAAVDDRTDRRVAIKVISEEHARDAELVARFFAEAHAATRIHHPNIIEVLDLAYLPDGRPAIVMELLAGTTLRQLIEGGTLAIATTLDLVAQVLDAVEAAHAEGIIHRDLKPDNVIVDEHGRAKVLDFGIAKLTGGDAGAPRTRTGMMLGTPEYMAPEQITGREVDGRSDIYAVGVVLYEALTGRRPFTADSQFEIMRAHLEAPAPSPRLVRAELPEALARVTMQAMAKQPDQRFGSARAMANALADARARWTEPSFERPSDFALEHAPAAVLAADSPVGDPRAAPATRHRSLARSRRIVGASAVVATLATIGIAAITMHRGPAEETREAKPTPPSPKGSPATPSSIAPPPPPTASPDYRTYAAPANLDHFDASGALAEATRRARELLHDAMPVYGEFNATRSDGTNDLHLHFGHPQWMFFSPAVAAKRPLTLAPNLDFRARCAVIVEFDQDFTRATVVEDICDRKAVREPRCTIATIWKRAIARGAKPSYAANVRFANGTWMFDIFAGKDSKSLQFPDDC